MFLLFYLERRVIQCFCDVCKILKHAQIPKIDKFGVVVICGVILQVINSNQFVYQYFRTLSVPKSKCLNKITIYCRQCEEQFIKYIILNKNNHSNGPRLCEFT